ncbi:hypothetical protein VMCG_04075 [Cytospora schulzeri]|uniref:SGNH hydrolase-type esterase domain-containing protein n=1 Tax=Cytospora schulzeri TaxID=448051 RepID=A0A423WUG4_9PEZI|nr:hypothetical protein VMCG_04075 [Valsa malicola]
MPTPSSRQSELSFRFTKMITSLRLFVAVTFTLPFASALTIPDSVPDSQPSPNNVLPPTNQAAGSTNQAAQQQQKQKDQDTVLKILVCGDSITQGKEGQFTWRYRLWEWFHANSESHALTQSQTPGTSPSQSTTTTTTASDDDSNSNSNEQEPYHYPTLQFVGPYNGTLPTTTTSANTTTAWGADPMQPQTWGAYHPTVHPTFYPGGGSSHFAVYGRPAWMDVDLIGAQVQAHRPDVVVLHLGFNDIGWWAHSAADLVGTMQRLVFFSRLARADVAVLIADVSHRVGVAGREDIPVTTAEYNRVIVEKAREWSTEKSPVEVVRVSHVESCPAGFDGLHPNSLGDYQIARAYTQVFHEKFRLGSGPLEVPAVNTIPGMSSPSGPMSSAMGVIMSAPPLGIFAGVVLLGLVLAMVLRPELLRLKRLGKGRYHLLPSR